MISSGELHARYIPENAWQFWMRHPDSKASLTAWRRLVAKALWKSFDQVKADFGKRIDQYRHFVIFDVGGNKYRLIAAIHYNTGRVYIRQVLTHAEYDLEKWKEV